MDKATQDKINELRKEVDKEWAFDRRKEYLKDLMTDLIVDWWYERSYLADYIQRGRMLEVILTQEEMSKTIKAILKYQKEIYYRRRAMSGHEIGITVDEIRQAKEYPWEELLPFVHGKALCPFHDDHNPSFSVKNGTGKCWSCGWKGDQIDFFMAKNGRSFAEAVRSLI